MQCDAMLCDAMQRTSVSARRLRSRLCNNVHSFGGREEKERDTSASSFLATVQHASIFLSSANRKCDAEGEHVAHTDALITLHCIASYCIAQRSGKTPQTPPRPRPRHARICCPLKHAASALLTL